MCRKCYNAPTRHPLESFVIRADPTTHPMRHLEDEHHIDNTGKPMLIGKKRKHQDIAEQLKAQKKANDQIFDTKRWR